MVGRPSFARRPLKRSRNDAHARIASPSEPVLGQDFNPASSWESLWRSRP